MKWDHPHVCGEKLATMRLPETALGSPPRVWGKGAVNAGNTDSPGITPTCVGKSAIALIPPSARRNHPHVCGEKIRTLHKRKT